MPLNGVAAVHHVDQSLGDNTKGIETIFLGYLNSRLEEPRDEREEDLETSLGNHGLEYVRRHFTPISLWVSVTLNQTSFFLSHH